MYVDRLPQRREHKGIQVAPYRLFVRLAAYLQHPSFYRRAPPLASLRGPLGSPSGGAPREGAPRGGGPKGGAPWGPPLGDSEGAPSEATAAGIKRAPEGAAAEHAGRSRRGAPLVGGPSMGAPRVGPLVGPHRGPPSRMGRRRLPLLFEVSSPELCCQVVASACALGLPLLHLYRLVVLRAAKEKGFFHLEHLISLAK